MITTKRLLALDWRYPILGDGVIPGKGVGGIGGGRVGGKVAGGPGGGVPTRELINTINK